MYVNPRPPIHPLTSPSLGPATGLSEALFRASASLASLPYLLLHPHHISGLWLLHACGSCSYNAIPTTSALPTPARPLGISTSAPSHRCRQRWK